MDDRVGDPGDGHEPQPPDVRGHSDPSSTARPADGVHQGLALKVPPYEYAHPIELLDAVLAEDETPLLVALDGITDPRNLGAILRSTAAFGGRASIVPQRRSAG